MLNYAKKWLFPTIIMLNYAKKWLFWLLLCLIMLRNDYSDYYYARKWLF